MSFWDSLFGSSKYTNPASVAMPYLVNIGPKADINYLPYMSTGLNSMAQYYGNASNWANPQGAMDNYNTIAAGYSASPYSQYQDQQMQQAAAQSAAASGMAGTPSQQAAVANQINQINSRDEQQYINSILGTQQQGQEDLGNLTHLGYQAANEDVNDWIKQYMEQAGLSYAGQMNQNAFNSQPTAGDIFGSALGLGGLSYLFGSRGLPSLGSLFGKSGAAGAAGASTLLSPEVASEIMMA